VPETIAVIVALVMAGCTVVCGLALWRRWSVPLWVSLAVGLAVRILIAVLANGHTPSDVASHFQQVATAVLDHRDPLVVLHRYQWNFLPFSAYLLAAEAKTGLPWQLAVKILPVCCDVATIYLIGRFARPAVRNNVQFVYALCPLAILISAWHGQIEPIAIMLGLCALLLARKRMAVWAGAVVGLAVASKTWPVLFVPGVFRDLPRTRWWQAAASGVVVLGALLASIPMFLHDSVHRAISVILGYRSFLGTWGWTGVLRYMHLAGDGYSGPLVDKWQHVGTVLMVVTLLVVLVVFRRCSGPDLTLALLLAFLAVSAGFGPQYLLWPVALLIATRRPIGWVYVLLATSYATLFYLYSFPRHDSLKSWPGAVLELTSIAVVIVAIAAMPWSQLRRGGRASDGDQPLEPEHEEAREPAPSQT
jgi:Glycosyltransferase family 87